MALCIYNRVSGGTWPRRQFFYGVEPWEGFEGFCTFLWGSYTIIPRPYNQMFKLQSMQTIATAEHHPHL